MVDAGVLPPNLDTEQFLLTQRCHERHTSPAVHQLDAAGPAEEHHKVYRSGLDRYEQVLRNVIQLGRALARRSPNTTLGIGYILVPFQASGAYRATEENIQGIRSAITRISDEVSLDYACFRPYCFYFSGDELNARQPDDRHYAETAARLRSVLGQSIGGARIDVWDEAFAAIQRQAGPDCCVATPWATSITEKGVGYIASELNGSPQQEGELLSLGVGRSNGLPKYAWGDMSSQAFSDAWFATAPKVGAALRDGPLQATHDPQALFSQSGPRGVARHGPMDGRGSRYPLRETGCHGLAQPAP